MSTLPCNLASASLKFGSASAQFLYSPFPINPNSQALIASVPTNTRDLGSLIQPDENSLLTTLNGSFFSELRQKDDEHNEKLSVEDGVDALKASIRLAHNALNNNDYNCAGQCFQSAVGLLWSTPSDSLFDQELFRCIDNGSDLLIDVTLGMAAYTNYNESSASAVLNGVSKARILIENRINELESDAHPDINEGEMLRSNLAKLETFYSYVLMQSATIQNVNKRQVFKRALSHLESKVFDHADKPYYQEIKMSASFLKIELLVRQLEIAYRAHNQSGIKELTKLINDSAISLLDTFKDHPREDRELVATCFAHSVTALARMNLWKTAKGLIETFQSQGEAYASTVAANTLTVKELIDRVRRKETTFTSFIKHVRNGFEKIGLGTLSTVFNSSAGGILGAIAGTAAAAVTGTDLGMLSMAPAIGAVAGASAGFALGSQSIVGDILKNIEQGADHVLISEEDSKWKAGALAALYGANSGNLIQTSAIGLIGAGTGALLQLGLTGEFGLMGGAFGASLLQFANRLRNGWNSFEAQEAKNAGIFIPQEPLSEKIQSLTMKAVFDAALGGSATYLVSTFFPEYAGKTFYQYVKDNSGNKISKPISGGELVSTTVDNIMRFWVHKVGYGFGKMLYDGWGEILQSSTPKALFDPASYTSIFTYLSHELGQMSNSDKLSLGIRGSLLTAGFVSAAAYFAYLLLSSTRPFFERKPKDKNKTEQNKKNKIEKINWLGWGLLPGAIIFGAYVNALISGNTSYIGLLEKGVLCLGPVIEGAIMMVSTGSAPFSKLFEKIDPYAMISFAINVGVSSAIGGGFQKMMVSDPALIAMQGAMISVGLLPIVMGVSGFVKRQIGFEQLAKEGYMDTRGGMFKKIIGGAIGILKSFNSNYVKNRAGRAPTYDLLAASLRASTDWNSLMGYLPFMILNNIFTNPATSRYAPEFGGQKTSIDTLIKTLKTEDFSEMRTIFLKQFTRTSFFHPLLPHSPTDRAFIFHAISLNFRWPRFPMLPELHQLSALHQILLDRYGNDKTKSTENVKMESTELEKLFEFIIRYSKDPELYDLLRSLVGVLHMSKKSEKFGVTITEFLKQFDWLNDRFAIDPSLLEYEVDQFSRIALRENAREALNVKRDDYEDSAREFASSKISEMRDYWKSRLDNSTRELEILEKRIEGVKIALKGLANDGSELYKTAKEDLAQATQKISFLKKEIRTANRQYNRSRKAELREVSYTASLFELPTDLGYFKPYPSRELLAVSSSQFIGISPMNQPMKSR